MHYYNLVCDLSIFRALCMSTPVLEDLERVLTLDKGMTQSAKFKYFLLTYTTKRVIIILSWKGTNFNLNVIVKKESDNLTGYFNHQARLFYVICLQIYNYQDWKNIVVSYFSDKLLWIKEGNEALIQFSINDATMQ